MSKVTQSFASGVRQSIENVKLLVKPDETDADLVAEICDELSIGPNQRFLFSAILLEDTLTINYFPTNPYLHVYSPEAIIDKLLYHTPAVASNAMYARAPLEKWIVAFQPSLDSMVNRVYPVYQKLFPVRDELMSSLHLVCIELYNKGYYLSYPIVYKSFINQMNAECRKIKHFQNMQSFDKPVTGDEVAGDEELTLGDMIADPDASAWAYGTRYLNDEEIAQEKADLIKLVKATMLSMMSEARYNRILFQLRTKNITRDTSYVLDKLRTMFGTYIPRPNRRNS